MKLFGDKPQERAMRTLIHDTNRDISHITNILYNRVSLNADEIDRVKKALKRLEEDIDLYYNRFEKDFES